MNHLQDYFFASPIADLETSEREIAGKRLGKQCLQCMVWIQKSFIVVLVLVFHSLAGTIWEHVA